MELTAMAPQATQPTSGKPPEDRSLGHSNGKAGPGLVPSHVAYLRQQFSNEARDLILSSWCQKTPAL